MKKEKEFSGRGGKEGDFLCATRNNRVAVSLLYHGHCMVLVWSTIRHSTFATDVGLTLLTYTLYGKAAHVALYGENWLTPQFLLFLHREANCNKKGNKNTSLTRFSQTIPYRYSLKYC